MVTFAVTNTVAGYRCHLDLLQTPCCSPCAAGSVWGCPQSPGAGHLGAALLPPAAAALGVRLLPPRVHGQ